MRPQPTRPSPQDNTLALEPDLLKKRGPHHRLACDCARFERRSACCILVHEVSGDPDRVSPAVVIRTVLPLRMAISMILPNCRSRLFLKLPGLMRDCRALRRRPWTPRVACGRCSCRSCRSACRYRAQALAQYGARLQRPRRDRRSGAPVRSLPAPRPRIWRVVASMSAVSVLVTPGRRSARPRRRATPPRSPPTRTPWLRGGRAALNRHRKAHRHSPFRPRC